MNSAPVFIEDYSIACALGGDKVIVAQHLFATEPPVVAGTAELNDGRSVPVGRLAGLAPLAGQTRTNCILAQCFAPLAESVNDAKSRYGAARLGVVVGTSTSGIGEGGEAIRARLAGERWPPAFSVARQQLGDSARFLARLCGAEGAYYTVSTACTSGARAMAAGARLIQADVCDAVLCGGADALCALTLNGFAALEALSRTVANPMSVNRSGLNLGEGGALFLLSRRAAPSRLAGWGESADGHHMSAPDPEGGGAVAAMQSALARGRTSDIDFVHLHGTATPLNDKMEAGVVARAFGSDVPCASTKPLTGHTLGAAGAVQAGLCLLAMERGRLPPHVWDGERDPELAHIRLTRPGERATVKNVLSASYAFGGNNAVLVLARE